MPFPSETLRSLLTVMSLELLGRPLAVPLAVGFNWAAEGALCRSWWSAWPLLFDPAGGGRGRALDFGDLVKEGLDD